MFSSAMEFFNQPLQVKERYKQQVGSETHSGYIAMEQERHVMDFITRLLVLCVWEGGAQSLGMSSRL